MANSDNKRVEEFKIPLSEKAQVYQISYSPDGNRILYSLSDIKAYPILTSYFYDLRKKEEIQLGPPNANCSYPKWSPNGREILLYCNLSTDASIENSHVYILDFIGNDPIVINEIVDLPCGEQLTWAPGNNFAWAPDGKHFVATSCKFSNDPGSLFIFNSDGSIDKGFSPLGTLDTPAYITEVAWSPDGQQIIYIAGKDKDSLNIYVMNVDGSNNHTVTMQASNYSELSVYPIE